MDFIIHNSVLTRYTGCDAHIVIPDGVTQIGESAFKDNTRLISVRMGKGVVSIGEMAFHSCAKLELVTLPESLKEIHALAFYGCKRLRSADLPDGLESLHAQAFDYCESLTSVRIPASVRTFQWFAFHGCINLRSAVIEEGITRLPSHTFDSCKSLVRISLPESMNSVESAAFSGCSSLSSIDLPDGIREITHSLFMGCKNLTSIRIPDGVREITSFAFTSSGLTSIYLPDSVDKVGGYAFSSCKNLAEANVPASFPERIDVIFSSCPLMSEASITRRADPVCSDEPACSAQPARSEPAKQTVPQPFAERPQFIRPAAAYDDHTLRCMGVSICKEPFDPQTPLPMIHETLQCIDSMRTANAFLEAVAQETAGFIKVGSNIYRHGDYWINVGMRFTMENHAKWLDILNRQFPESLSCAPQFVAYYLLSSSEMVLITKIPGSGETPPVPYRSVQHSVSKQAREAFLAQIDRLSSKDSFVNPSAGNKDFWHYIESTQTIVINNWSSLRFGVSSPDIYMHRKTVCDLLNLTQD